MSDPPSEPILGVIETNLGSKIRVLEKLPFGRPMSKYMRMSVTFVSEISTTLNTACVSITVIFSYSIPPSKSCAFVVKLSPFTFTYHAKIWVSNSITMLETDGT